MKMKKVLAVVMSLCMTTGVISYGAPVISQGIIAQAESVDGSCYTFNETTGILTLKGNVDGDELRGLSYYFRNQVKSVVAEKGTVLPRDSSELFYNFRECTAIDLSNANTSKVTNMSSMFDCCFKLTKLKTHSFDTSNVTDMSKMFNGCYALTEIDLSSFDTSKVTNMSSMFMLCHNLTTLDLSGFDTSNVINMSSMFHTCYKLSSLNVSALDTSNVTSINGMFMGCSSLPTLNVSGFDTSKVTNMSYMFSACRNLTTLDLSGFNTSNVTNMSDIFFECTGLTTIDFSGFDTSNVTNMSSMFNNCPKLTSLDLSGFDTSSVTDMSSMFGGCENLTELDLSGFDTSNVTKINGMFANCTGFTKIDLSSFDTNKVEYMRNVFSGCTNLTSLDLSGFDTSNVKNMWGMFQSCFSLQNLDISSFDTRNVTEMRYLFSLCTSLKTLKISENFKNITADANLPNGEGWVNAKATSTIISGDGEYAVIENSGKNTYKRLPIKAENPKNALTYPTNIKVEYSKEYHQVRFTWDKVKDADRYAIAIYIAGKWKVQTQNITDTVYISPKNLTPGMTYKVAIAARVNGIWDTKNAIRHPVIVNIPFDFRDRDGDGIRDNKDSQPDQENNYPRVLVDYINNDIIDMDYTEETDDDFVICKTPLSEILSSCDVNTITDSEGADLPVEGYYDDWYIMALNRNGKATYGLYKMREQEYDSYDNNDPGVTISFVEFDISKLNDVIYHNTSDTLALFNEIQKVTKVVDAPYSSELQSYFVDVDSDAPYLIAEAYVDKIANSAPFSPQSLIPFPDKLNDIYDEIDSIDAQISYSTNIPSINPNIALILVRQKLSRVPDALSDCNNNFGSIIADENTKLIHITSSNNLDYYEKIAILSAYTADTSFNMFAAEVQFHADYLYNGSIVYSNVLRADMSIGESLPDLLTDTYHNPYNSRVTNQASAHGEY